MALIYAGYPINCNLCIVDHRSTDTAAARISSALSDAGHRVRHVMADELLPGCYSCDRQARTDLPPREDVVHTAHWRVAHAFNSSLAGWLVLVPTRHLTSMSELSPEAADELGGLLRMLSRALETVTGCSKTYVMQFSEAEGFTHLHLHLVPRMPDQPEHARGPRVFTYLDQPEGDWISESDRDSVALAIRARATDIP